MEDRVFLRFEDWFNMRKLMSARLVVKLAALCCTALSLELHADDGNTAQHRAAEEYLAAVAAG
ncbi:MAG: hypothetical protein ABIP38_07390, partial [Steroidobacteraceae bacterium]